MSQTRQCLLLLLLFLIAQVVLISHSQASNQANSFIGTGFIGTMPQFFTAPAIDESDMDYYLSEGVALDRILNFAWSKAETGYYKGAEFYFRLASERFTNSYQAQASLATFFYQMGKIPAAIEQFQFSKMVATNESDRQSANYG